MIELSFDTIIVAALDKELPLSLPPSSVNLIKKHSKVSPVIYYMSACIGSMGDMLPEKTVKVEHL